MEFVYVVPRGKLFPSCYPQGLVPFEGPGERADFEDRVRREGFFCERAYAERTPELKQVIPYVVFVVDGEVLLMRRLERGGERRLHDKLSIGVGGHVNPEDLEEERCDDPILAGTRREIDEEVLVRGSYELRAVGYLNDDSNPVGAVHLGLVQIAEVDGTVEIREKDVLEGTLVSPQVLARRLAAGEDFESWSSILIERLPALLAGAGVPSPTQAPVTA